MNSKYVRIQTHENGNGEPIGIFHACWGLVNDHVMEPDDLEQFLRIDKWFTDHLPRPPFYKTGNPEKATTWFKCEANDMLKMIEPLMALLDKYGLKYNVFFADHFGTIIYEDEYQVAVIDSSL